MNDIATPQPDERADPPDQACDQVQREMPRRQRSTPCSQGEAPLLVNRELSSAGLILIDSGADPLMSPLALCRLARFTQNFARFR